MCKICQKRHYGLCADISGIVITSKEPARRKKSKSAEAKAGIDFGMALESRDLPERVLILEALVAELIESRQKRSVYMKAYMRDYRERGS